MNVMMKEQAWNEKAFDSARMGRRRKSKECIILAEEVLGMPPRTTETCIIDRAMLMLAADCLSSMLEQPIPFSLSVTAHSFSVIALAFSILKNPYLSCEMSQLPHHFFIALSSSLSSSSIQSPSSPPPPPPPHINTIKMLYAPVLQYSTPPFPRARIPCCVTSG
jgi:hypothetical protein